MRRRSFGLLNLLVAAAMVTSFILVVSPAQAVSPDIVISQVYGGGGNSGATYTNDFIELYNRGGAAVNVTGWTVQYASTAGTTWQKTTLAGIIQPSAYYLVQEAQGAGGTVGLPTPNAIGTIPMSGTAGKVALANNSTTLAGSCPAGLVDFVGYGSATNCFETTPTSNLSNTTAALRNGNGATDTDINSVDFAIGAPNPRNTPPPDAAASVASTVPTSGAGSVPLGSDITVTFSEPVNVADGWFTLVCSLTGNHDAVFSGGSTTFTINPEVDFVNGDDCTLTVLAANVTDQDTNDPPDNMAANFVAGFSTGDVCLAPYTPIPAIQGSGATVALTGAQTSQAVVVGDYEGPSPALRGFFIQDPTGDGNPATSDGVFVFEGSNADSVSVGDVVRVTGTAEEYQGQSQISVGTIVKCGTGTVTPTDVSFPVASADFLERYEGMLVRLPQTMYVTEHFQLGRFGQVVLSSGGRLQQPTNIVAPGGAALAVQAQNNLNRIILDDASQAQNPDPIVFARGGQPLSASNTLRGGDTATGIVGVLNYTWAGYSASGNAYRIRPINALNGYVNFQPANPRPASAPSVGGALKVAAMNTLNFFNTFDGLPDTVDNCRNGVNGIATDCRGADTQAEFDRQWPKTVAAILSVNADVLGVNEIENDGYGPDSAIKFLVDKLNLTAGAGTYALIDADAATGQVNALGTDAIKVGLIYRPARVIPIGQTAVLNSVAFVNGGDSAPRSRPSLAQAFVRNSTGGRFIVDVNHLKSKGSACDAPDAGDGQGNCNQVRVNAAAELLRWLATNPTGTGDPDVLLLGDYNSYAMEDPITAIKNAGYTNLIGSFLGPDAYSYVFDGQWGYLDQALGSAGIVGQIAGVADYHINADEPSVLDYNTDFKSAGQISSLYAPDKFRVSDHDIVVVGLNLVNDPPDLGIITGPVTPVRVNTVASLSVPFTDRDALDTHTAIWTWGDGSTSTGKVTEANGAGTVTRGHIYSTPGIYVISVTLSDNFGHTDKTTYPVIVYAPNGGYMTGGGWFISPPGAWKLNPAISGQLTLSFAAKYLPGATVPTGQVAFEFKAAGISFRSTALHWMVTNKTDLSAQIKGIGTLNGRSGYQFIIMPRDSSPDRIRIQVWNPSGLLIYDTGTKQPLGGGSIVFNQ